MPRLHVALTGATGFIGSALAQKLSTSGYPTRLLSRRPPTRCAGCAATLVGDLRDPRGLEEALSGVDVVVHAAAKTAAQGGLSDSDYYEVNTIATVQLANAAQRAGVARFVYLSSISAQSGPRPECTLTEDLSPSPVNAYGRSKLAAEQELSRLAIDWVALRPVSVYGLEPKGKLVPLLRLARSPLPLPFADLKSPRSLCFLDNLVSAVEHVCSVSGPVRRSFIVSDPDALSLPEMVTAMRRGLGRRPGLVPVPQSLLKLLATLTGYRRDYERLACTSFVASSRALMQSGWRPVARTEKWLAAMARKTELTVTFTWPSLFTLCC